MVIRSLPYAIALASCLEAAPVVAKSVTPPPPPGDTCPDPVPQPRANVNVKVSGRLSADCPSASDTCMLDPATAWDMYTVELWAILRPRKIDCNADIASQYDTFKLGQTSPHPSGMYDIKHSSSTILGHVPASNAWIDRVEFYLRIIEPYSELVWTSTTVTVKDYTRPSVQTTINYHFLNDCPTQRLTACNAFEPIYRMQLRFWTANSAGAGTVDHEYTSAQGPKGTPVQVFLSSRGSTYLDYARKDFAQGSGPLTYDLNSELATRLQDLVYLRVTNFGDDWKVRKMQLLVNDIVVFSFAPQSPFAVDGAHPLYISSNMLRQKATWQGYQSPRFPSLITSDELADRLEGRLGDALARLNVLAIQNQVDKELPDILDHLPVSIRLTGVGIDGEGVSGRAVDVGPGPANSLRVCFEVALQISDFDDFGFRACGDLSWECEWDADENGTVMLGVTSLGVMMTSTLSHYQQLLAATIKSQLESKLSFTMSLRDLLPDRCDDGAKAGEPCDDDSDCPESYCVSRDRSDVCVHLNRLIVVTEDGDIAMSIEDICTLLKNSPEAREALSCDE